MPEGASTRRLPLQPNSGFPGRVSKQGTFVFPWDGAKCGYGEEVSLWLSTRSVRTPFPRFSAHLLTSGPDTQPLCGLSTLFEQNHNLLSKRRRLSVQGVWVRHKNERFPSTFGDRVDVKGGERYENKFRTSVLLSNLY
jgi:hypothetical protein